MIYRLHFFRNLLARLAAIIKPENDFFVQRQSARPILTKEKNLKSVKTVMDIFSIRICKTPFM